MIAVLIPRKKPCLTQIQAGSTDLARITVAAISKQSRSTGMRTGSPGLQRDDLICPPLSLNDIRHASLHAHSHIFHDIKIIQAGPT